MDAPKRLSEFLQQAADQAGDPALFEGAIVFVALDRTVGTPNGSPITTTSQGFFASSSD
jgi:hypothetical protein